MKRAALLIGSVVISSSALAQYEGVVIDGDWSGANSAYGGFQYGNLNGTATRWNGPGAREDLEPDANFYAAREGQVVGDRNSMAALYTESTNTWVNLHPYSLADYSVSYGLWGSTQVGRGGKSSASFQLAFLWSGTAASVTVLNPAGMDYCEALGVYENTQVGIGMPNHSFGDRAMLWHGSAASAVSLHMAGAVESRAYAAWGDLQGGYYEDATGKQSAVLWHGSASDYTNIMPPGWRQSFIWGMGPDIQVGYGTKFFTNARALAWHGTSESYIDLHDLLPAEAAFDYSYAIGVDPITGDIVGMAGHIDGAGIQAVMWRPTAVPEPATFAVLGLASLVVARRSRLRRERG